MLKKLIVPLLLLSASTVSAQECPVELKHIKRKLNSQETVNLCQEYQGKAILFVNTASYCGFTKQFEGLEHLYDTYKDDGFVVLGFPSHDFNQEDKDEAKTAELCELTYGVEFPMFEPTHVVGDEIDPLFRALTEKTETTVKWNFYKYLMSKDGKTIKAYNSYTKPTDPDFIKDVELALNPL